SNELVTVLPNGNVGINNPSPEIILDINDTGAIQVSVGTTVQRPPAQNGRMRYNSDNDSLEVVIAGTWQSLAAAANTGSFVRRDGDSMTGTLNLTDDADIEMQSGSQLLSDATATPTAPSISFLGDNDTGIYSAGSNEIGFATAGVARVILGSAS